MGGKPHECQRKTDKKSIAARLVGMAQERYLLGVSEDGEPFGADRTRPHLAMLLRGGRTGLRADLASRYFTDTGAAAGGQALTDSTLILGPLAHMPSGRFGANSAWILCAAIAHNLLHAAGVLAGATNAVARGSTLPSMRSENTVSMMAWRRWVISAASTGSSVLAKNG